MNIDLEGRVALVTGGAGGIGMGIARALARAGADIIVNDVKPEEAERAAATIDRASAAPGDVSDASSVEALISSLGRASAIDILINNAGVSEPLAPIERQRPEDWDRVIGINLRGAFLMSRAVAPLMKRKRGGSIVNIASIAGIGGFPASHAYGVSKAGVVMMTRTLACELARHGIRVNAVAPGVIDAPMLDAMSHGGDYLPEIVARVPLGRLGETSDIGAAAAFLCSDLAEYITGITLPVDGGWLAFTGAGAAYHPPKETIA